MTSLKGDKTSLVDDLAQIRDDMAQMKDTVNEIFPMLFAMMKELKENRESDGLTNPWDLKSSGVSETLLSSGSSAPSIMDHFHLELLMRLLDYR